MGQSIIQENIPTLVVASTTSVQIPATNLGQSTRITVGGQQYSPSSALTLNTGGTGANGLDTGTLGSIQLWYVYAIVNQTTFAMALVASLSAPSTGPAMPAGYGTAFKLVGAFYTNGSNQVGAMVQLVGPISTDWMSYTPTVTGLTDNTGTIQGWWRRDAVKLEYRVDFVKSGVAGSGSSNGIFGGPAGLTMASSYLNDSGTTIVGIANTYSVEALNVYDRANVTPDGGSGTGVRLVDPGASNVYHGSDFRAGCQVNLIASYAVNEWAGKPTLL